MDWNNNGKLDLITGERDGYVRIYLNTGTREAPVFSGFTRLQVGGSDFQTLSSKPFIVDWNNNGKLDVLVGADNGLIYLLLNTGTRENPQFSSAVPLQAGSSNMTAGTRASPVAVDWTRNGKKDIIVGVTDGTLHLFENIGTDASPVFGPTSRQLQAGGANIDVVWYSRPAVADWNNNGRWDLIVGCYDPNASGRVWLFLADSPPLPATLEISGRVLDKSGTGMAGVTMTGLPENPVTDANGFYSDMVWDGWTETVSPVSENYAFIPAQRSYASVNEEILHQNYSAFFDKRSTETIHNDGHIPTDPNFTGLPGQSSAPGIMTVSIPSNAVITGVDVSYTMTAQNAGWISDQRSWLRCVSPGGAGEATIALGSGTEGTFYYSRSGLTIANGVTGGGDIVFELHAGRTWGGGDEVNTTYNKVDEGSWQIHVHYYIEECTRPVLDEVKMTLGSASALQVQIGLPAHLYTLQYILDLTDADRWQNVPGQTQIPGTGEPLEMSLEAMGNEPAAFYRVLMEPAP